jgi:hypothetical protein
MVAVNQQFAAEIILSTANQQFTAKIMLSVAKQYSLPNLFGQQRISNSLLKLCCL